MGTSSTEILSECLATCDALLQELATSEAECHRLRNKVSEEQHGWQRFFDVVPMPCILSDAEGVILSANRAAALFLNVSAMRLQGRTLTHFILDRQKLAALLEDRTTDASILRASFRIRPREKAITEIDVTIVPDAGMNTDAWIWFLMPADHARQIQEMTSSGQPSSELPDTAPERPELADQDVAIDTSF